MDDYERLISDLNDGQYTLLSALADLMDEMGRQDLTRGLRWLAQHKRWPIRMSNRGEVYYTWWQDKREDHEAWNSTSGRWTRQFVDANPDSPVFSCTLPGIILTKIKELCQVVRDKEGARLRFPRSADAVMGAATAIAELEDHRYAQLMAWSEVPDCPSGTDE